jgi:hypothetical protein
MPDPTRIPRDLPPEPLDRLEAAIVYAMQRAARKREREKMRIVDGGRGDRAA